jgi:hypothetical protein
LDAYSYPYNHIVKKPASTEQEYAYAKDTNVPRKTGDGKAAHAQEAPRDGGPMYHTLEPPEYSYAKITDMPKDTADKTVVPNEPANNAVSQHTLEETTKDVYVHPGVCIPTQQQYTSETTDIPKTNENSSSSFNSALYHTLEEPNPPEAPACSDLERAEN